MTAQRNDKPRSRSVGALEWLAAGFGLLLSLALLAFLAWQASRQPSTQLPTVTVNVLEVREADGLHVVVVEVRNRTAATAANVTVAGTLRQGGRTIEQSEFTLDYVPGGSSRRGGLFFTSDPTLLELEVRALGYTNP